jgi:hypothetical protein
MINTGTYTVLTFGAQGKRTVRRWRCEDNINIQKYSESGNCIELMQDGSVGELL